MQELLARFVTVADEVGRLQRGGDAECELFRGFCEQGHYGGRSEPTGTRQGLYAVTPSGRLLSSVNTQSPQRVVAMLQQALQRWAELPAAERQLDAARLEQLAATKRFEDRHPADGLVLAEYLRDLDRPDTGDWRGRAWNQDQVWFTRSEAAAFVPEARVGARREVERRLVERLVRLHLIDSVRGQTPAFPKDAVVTAELISEVVASEGPMLHLRLSGKTAAVATGRWPIRDRGEPVAHERGVRCELLGRAIWNGERFTSCELVAIGERWGATQYNGRGDDLSPSRIGFAFVLAQPDHPRVAPAFFWDYDLR